MRQPKTRFAEFMIDNHLTAARIASRAGVSESHVSDVRSGRLIRSARSWSRSHKLQLKSCGAKCA